MMLMLMLAVAVMTIMALRVSQSYRHRIQRDREVEMIHRGVQYARAVKRYYRKFGIYPTSIEQLEETNKIRFLRKRYEDPMATDGKWKIAHLNDIKLPGIEGIMKSAPNTAPGATATSSASSKSSAGEDGEKEKKKDEATVSTIGDASAPDSEASSDSNSNSAFGGEVLGPMLGVMSKSKRTGIHTFNDKSRYNEWYFIYAPTQDHGQLITGPFNPSLTGAAATVTSTGGEAGSPTAPASTGTPGNAAGTVSSQ